MTEASVETDSAVQHYRARVADRLAEVRQRIESAQAAAGRRQLVTIVAVTKTHGPEAVEAAYHAGLQDVGENRVQEAESKMAMVTVPMRWHLIGHLQRNKVKAALHFDLVHAIDSLRLAEALHAAALAAGRVRDVLVQVNVSGEDTKGGIAPAEINAVAERLHACTALRVRGVMTMAPFDAPDAVLRTVFSGARTMQERLAVAGHPAVELSMGMSGDYEVAVQEGATLVRLGTVLFGSRAG